MPDLKESLTQGISQGFSKFQKEKETDLSWRNPQASNFLKAFLGSGALQFKDDSGSVSIDPRTGAFSGTPNNPEGIGFSLNPLTQSASIRKGNFELSGGLSDAPIPMSSGYGSTSQSFSNWGGPQKQSPWGMIGFKFGGQTPIENPSESDIVEQSPKRQFANPDVENLLNRTTSPWHSGPDKYNPATW